MQAIVEHVSAVGLHWMYPLCVESSPFVRIIDQSQHGKKRGWHFF